jgi:L-iditol 2-dehydrogenase
MALQGTMIAAVHYGHGQIEAREVEYPEPGPGELLIKVDRAAICGSDVHTVFDGIYHRGHPGFPSTPVPGRPGHEAVGTVVISNSDAFSAGDRVLVMAHGTFTQYMAAPAAMCVPIPDGQPFDRMLMAQQLGVCVYAMDQFWTRTRPAEGVAVLIGAGSIGLHFLQLIKRRGFEQVIVADLSEARLQAASALGASQVVLAPGGSVVDAVMAASEGGAALALEAAGYDETRAQAMACVRSGGRVGLFGYPERTGPAEYPFYDLFWKGPISIEVALGAQHLDGLPTFHEAVGMIARSEVDVSHHLGTEFPLTEIGTAMQAARDMKAVKVQVVP